MGPRHPSRHHAAGVGRATRRIRRKPQRQPQEALPATTSALRGSLPALDQGTIDELHACGAYLSTGGESEELRTHHLIVAVENEDEAVPAAEGAVEDAGGSGAFELEGPAAGA